MYITVLWVYVSVLPPFHSVIVALFHCVWLQHRVAHVVEPRLKAIEDAYKAKDFPTFAKIAMQDSNQFHAVCADTYPPIYYMNDVSRKIVNLVHKINAAAGEVVVRGCSASCWYCAGIKVAPAAVGAGGLHI